MNTENNHQSALENAVILIPSLEPDERLPAYITRLVESGFGHVVVVDDGSSESYQPIFRRIETLARTVVLHHDVNHGKGVGLKTGYRYILENLPDCNGVITADADGQHTVADCIRLAEKLATGERALYLGSRDFGQKDVPPKSRFGNRTTSAVFAALYGQWLPDTQTGLRAFRKEDLQFMMDVEGERFEYEMNVLIACARSRMKMIPITIETVYENENTGTHFHPLRDSYRIYKVILGNFVRFAGSSIICFLVDWGLFNLLGLFLGSETAIMLRTVLARVVSATLNFVLNKTLVFKLKGNGKNAIWKYVALCAVIMVLSWLGTEGLVMIHVPAWLAKPVVDTVLYFLSYRIQHNWVFSEGD